MTQHSVSQAAAIGALLDSAAGLPPGGAVLSAERADELVLAIRAGRDEGRPRWRARGCAVLDRGVSIQMKAAAYGGIENLKAYEVEPPAPDPGEVTVEVRAAGVNPTDYKTISGYRGRDASLLPLPIGYEVSGVLRAVGEGSTIASGGGAVGDAVVAFRIAGGYSEAVTVLAADVFAKPATLSFPEAANLLLVGTTAADLLRVVPLERGHTVVVHGASGAVGVSLLQQIRLLGVRVIGTASASSAAVVERFGGEATEYGDGLAERLRQLAPDGFDAAFDCVGTDEAIDVSLALVPPDRLVTVAAPQRAEQDGFVAIGGAQPVSAAFRDSVRADLLAMAARGELLVPVARTFPLAEAVAALAILQDGHPGGKLALVP